MSLNINRNFAAMSGIANASLKSHQTAMGRAMNHVSTGKGVARASDGASSYMSSQKIRGEASGYEALNQGVQRAGAKLNTIDAATSSVLDVLQAMKAKVAEGLAASNDNDATSIITQELTDLKTALSTAVNTKYNNKFLLQEGGEATYLTFDSSTTNYTALQLTPSFSSIESVISDVARNVVTINTDGLLKLNGIIKSLTEQQGKIGSGINAMEYASSFLQSVADAENSAYASITDADMAKEMTAYVSNNVYSQAAQAMVSQANQSLAQVLNLLQ